MRLRLQGLVGVHRLDDPVAPGRLGARKQDPSLHQDAELVDMVLLADGMVGKPGILGFMMGFMV